MTIPPSATSRFRGSIGRTVAESTPAWEQPRAARTGSPNVITIVLDDVGFGQLGCYGSSIATPSIDSLAEQGARFANFHVAALCSPTRASLLTGRNHHAVGVGFLADFDSGFPGYRGAVDREVPMLPEILREEGYATYAVGKWHLTPPSQLTQAGPFEQWPTGRGFDRYYGFLGGEEDQWAPEMWEDQHYAPLPDDPDYHVSADLVNRSQRYLADHISAAPERPFYLHLAFGAGHAPHQAPAEYIERYRGAFDHGWDEERARILQKQIERGIVPAGTELPEANPGVRRWDVLTADEKRLYARMQEVFAAFMEYTDEQIGRLIDFLREQGVHENTLIVLLSDNGASGEGGTHGSANEYRYFLGLEDRFEDTLARIDELGSPLTHNHYPSGWAQAGNTPLKMYKKYTYGGGVRAPLIVHWPGNVADSDQVRRQFHHVTDLVPTILQAVGVDAPQYHRGARVEPFDGISLGYALAESDAVGKRATQYFETAGYRGIVKDGFKAVAVHEPGDDYDGDRWELYALESDFNETVDVAAEHPALVRELEEVWWSEAERNRVLPLDDRMQTRVLSRDTGRERARYRLLPGSRLPNGSAAPGFGDREFSITVRLDGFAGTESGVLVSYGRRAAGFSFFMEDGHLVFDLNRAGDHSLLRTPYALAPGTAEVSIALTRSDDGARATISGDGVEVASAVFPALMPAGLGCLSVQVGYNYPSPVSSLYERPARYTGSMVDAVIEFSEVPTGLSAQDWQRLIAAE
ncbi:arylsulfatase [Microbacterium sp. A94]|uniref:arylsulfatase n=1 Tax=Microbacterium sp. A94 TaxID=3450717 RepID=UPI003F42C143